MVLDAKVVIPEAPEYVTFQVDGVVSLRQDGFDPYKDNKVPIEKLTKEQIERYADEVRTSIIQAWVEKQSTLLGK